MLLAGSGVYLAVALVVVGATAVAGYIQLPQRLRQWLLAVLAGAAICNFVLHLLTLAPPIPYRLGHLLILGLYAALAISGGLAALGLRPAPMFATGVSIVLSLLVAEAVLGRQEEPATLVWDGGTSAHPVLGEYYPPNSSFRTLYPDNPRGYLDVVKPPPWILETHDPGSVADLQVSPDAAGLLKTTITRADVPTPWYIKVHYSGISVKAGESYVLSFRVRADAPRQIGYGIGLAHAPWDAIFYGDLILGSDWQNISRTLVLPRGDDNARIFFDLGAGTGRVEVDGVVLRRASGQVVQRPERTEYAITYQVNGLGCRGPDYAIPRPPAHHRILVLGDSFTLGVGVHQRDTFAAQLQDRLNKGPFATGIQNHEVINCGVSGYATREERLHYELISAQYDPQVVLVTMVFNDDISWLEEVQRGYDGSPRLYETWFRTAKLFADAFPANKRPYDYSQSLDELMTLSESVRARNSRLMVAIFRFDEHDDQSARLATSVASRLKGTDIPFVDLGEALSKYPNEELFVHDVDHHPNEVAHRVAADTLDRFLRSHHLIE